jgi:hypothetical protein
MNYRVAKNVAKSVVVTPGIARRVSVSVMYVSDDRRAVLIDIDTCTKYMEVMQASTFNGSAYAESHSVYLCKTEETLRPDNRYKKPTEVSFKLPRPRERWWITVERTRYGAIVYAICPEAIRT